MLPIVFWSSNCGFWSYRTLPYFQLSVRSSVRGVTSQLFLIILLFRLWKPFIFLMNIIWADHPDHLDLLDHLDHLNHLNHLTSCSPVTALLQPSTSQYSSSSVLTLSDLLPNFPFRNRIVYFVLLSLYLDTCCLIFQLSTRFHFKWLGFGWSRRQLQGQHQLQQSHLFI